MPVGTEIDVVLNDNVRIALDATLDRVIALEHRVNKISSMSGSSSERYENVNQRLTYHKPKPPASPPPKPPKMIRRSVSAQAEELVQYVVGGPVDAIYEKGTPDWQFISMLKACHLAR
jgi:hypothetical protein